MMDSGQPREGTSLLPKRTARLHSGKFYGLVAATALLAVIALLTGYMPSRGIVLDSVDDSIARIQAENKRLEHEEVRLVKISMEQKKRNAALVQVRAASESAIKNEEAEQLKSDNLKLLLKNAELKHQLLMDRFDKSGIAHRIENDLFTGSHNRRFRSKNLKISSLSRSGALSSRASKNKVQQLVGQYVKTCTPWGCKVTYQPEDGDANMTWYPGQSSTNKSNVWYGKGYKQLGMGSNLLLPFGPIRKQNMTRYQAPFSDLIPKHSKIGDNWVSFGHGDSFVKIENSGMGANVQLPPWKQGPLLGFNNYNVTLKPLTDFPRGYMPNGSDPSGFKEVNMTKWRCPGDPNGESGKFCISGGDGVDGVFESSPLSPNYFDPNKILMEKHGVRVDSWPGFSEPVGNHKWGGDAKDHYAPRPTLGFDYDKAKQPMWAFNNHALRSLPAFTDPEGPANKQLMLGAYWNSSSGLPDMNDNWVDNQTYSLQFEPVHTDTEEDDHFSNWTHTSPENVKLLYGESSIFTGLRSKKNSTTTEPDPWSLGDVPLNVSQFADLVGWGTARVSRTGEPLHDLEAGWQGQDLVTGGDLNLASAAPASEAFSGFAPSEGRVALEKKGVNVGSSWWG